MSPSLLTIEHLQPEHGRTVLVNWTLGNKCNYFCSYCPAELHSGSSGWPQFESMVFFCDRLIAHYREIGRSLRFQFTGGEPTLYRHFLDLVEHLKQKGCEVSLISNGSRRLSWWKEACPSLDGVVLTHHIEFADFSRFAEVTKFLSERIATHVNVAMLPTRFEECLADAIRLTEYCARITLTLKPLLIDFGSEMYVYSELQKEIMRTHSSTRTSVENGNAFRSRMRKSYSDHTVEVSSGSRFILDDENRWTGWTCHVGLELLVINAKGEVYRGTCRQGGRLGHIFDDSITFPATAVTCSQQICHCLADIMTTKIAAPVN